MKLVVTMQIKSDDDNVLAETSGVVERVEKRNTISTIAIVKQWVGEAYCTLTTNLFTRK